jgi:ribosomal protein S18 acetylase RimI-like enzyme
MGDGIEIREFQAGDLDAIVEFSLRAWDPVFASLREVLGDSLFFRLKPDWKTAQADEVTASCTSDERDAFVAVVDGRPVGFVTVALNAYNERMGVIDIIGVDPNFQRRGIATQLTRHALDHMGHCGMDIAALETGSDPGHAPARAAYESLGFTPLPVTRYLKLLDE